MNDHVVSLEWAKKLKEKGFPRETEFYWEFYSDIGELSRDGLVREIDRVPPNETDCLVYIAAPLATEILRELPDGSKLIKRGSGYDAQGPEFRYRLSLDENPANALAALYCEVKK